MLTFTLAISCWPLPICLDSWTWHSRFLCNIALYSTWPCFYHQSHPQLGIVFALPPPLHSFWSYFSTDRAPWPGEFLFQYPVILPFHTVHGILKARILKWFAIPFFSGPHSVRPLHLDPPILGCPAGLFWFNWVRQGCSPSVIRLTSFLWVWFQCVYHLMSSCKTYHLTWVSLPLGMGYLFTAAPAKHSCCSLPCMRVSPYCCPSWPSMWDRSSRPSCPCAATALQVAPPSCLQCGVAPPAAAPGLRRGVAPLGSHPWPWTVSEKATYSIIPTI